MNRTEEPAAVKQIARMFRQHDVAPADVVSPLYRQLTQEWAELHSTPSTPATVRRWGRSEKALAGFTLPGEIVDAIDAAGHDRTNELLLALIRLFQRGHQLAGRVVLQALLPKLAKTATHAGGMCTSSSDTWAEDRRHITLAEFWDVMADYPVDRRTSSVASNLALDTLHRVTGARKPPVDLPVDPHDFRDDETRDGARSTWLAGLSTTDPDPVEEITPDSDLLEVIAWGMRNDTISQDEAQLLVASYLPERTSGFGFADVADQLGLSHAAVRQRCSRASRKLTEAVRAELHSPATPAVAVQVACA
jgi:DNA-directed RNA polymerase specialized sigma24 family protein